MQTSTSLTFFTAIFVALGGALAEELMICCWHVRTELYYIDPVCQNQIMLHIAVRMSTILSPLDVDSTEIFVLSTPVALPTSPIHGCFDVLV